MDVLPLEVVSRIIHVGDFYKSELALLSRVNKTFHSIVTSILYRNVSISGTRSVHRDYSDVFHIRELGGYVDDHTHRLLASLRYSPSYMSFVRFVDIYVEDDVPTPGVTYFVLFSILYALTNFRNMDELRLGEITDNDVLTFDGVIGDVIAMDQSRIKTLHITYIPLHHNIELEIAAFIARCTQLRHLSIHVEHTELSGEGYKADMDVHQSLQSLQLKTCPENLDLEQRLLQGSSASLTALRLEFYGMEEDTLTSHRLDRFWNLHTLSLRVSDGEIDDLQTFLDHVHLETKDCRALRNLQVHVDVRVAHGALDTPVIYSPPASIQCLSFLLEGVQPFTYDANKNVQPTGFSIDFSNSSKLKSWAVDCHNYGEDDNRRVMLASPLDDQLAVKRYSTDELAFIWDW